MKRSQPDFDWEVLPEQNFYLNIIGKHATGKCSRCNVPETIKHFILQCSDNLELVTELTEHCTEKKN